MYEFRLPEGFLLGTANAAFQSEGAYDRDGKSMSMMDHYARTHAGKYQPGSDTPMTCDVPDDGCFFYDQYETYIEDMRKTGQDTYRMSLAWPRIIPDGVGEVNAKGIEFYNKVIDKLIACGITPLVDIYHWDLPMALVEKGGFRNPQFPEWFENYAKVCFETFGDRVKMWSTFNEPSVIVTLGYINGRFPPFEMDLRGGMEASLHLVVAHHRAVKLYKSMNLGGKIGAVLAIVPVTPADMTEEDVGAADRQAIVHFDWWMESMLEGHYPRQFLEDVPAYKEALPEGYQALIDQYYTRMDFVGINYYYPERCAYVPDNILRSTNVENFFSSPDSMFDPYPSGLFDALLHVSQRYGNIEMYITENGLSATNIKNKEKEIEDDDRIAYLREHLRAVVRCIKVGINLKGYYWWNDADSYEQLTGYGFRFGLTWVDHDTGEICWKKSRYYLQKICKTRMIN